MKIPITKPFFDNSEKEALLKPLESNWLVHGPYVAEFERLFCEFARIEYARAVTSCTAALHLSLEVLGIKSGDRVIVPSFTYVASANSIEYSGAEAVFCDIDLRTFNIDIKQAQEILDKDKDKTVKAIMPVNLFGLCANLTEIISLAKRYNVRIIEDSACGLGAYIGDKHSGTFGDIGCFSFHPRKAITTGEGGMLITGNRKIAEKASSLRNHGAEKGDFKRHKEKGGSLLPEFNLRGYNYRMTDLQGALGMCQMKKVRVILEDRKRIAEKYNGALKDISKLLIPYTPAGYTHAYQSYVCLFSDDENPSGFTIERIDRLNSERNSFMNRLQEKGISTRQGTHAIHTLGYYKNKYSLNDRGYLHSYAADRLTVALPLYAGMTDNEFDYVITNIKEVLR